VRPLHARLQFAIAFFVVSVRLQMLAAAIIWKRSSHSLARTLGALRALILAIPDAAAVTLICPRPLKI